MAEQAELGSDAMFPDYGDLEQTVQPVLEEDARLAEEERRVSAEPPAEEEPGEQFPDPDEAPPAVGAPDYDPLPPVDG